MHTQLPTSKKKLLPIRKVILKGNDFIDINTKENLNSLYEYKKLYIVGYFREYWASDNKLKLYYKSILGVEKKSLVEYEERKKIGNRDWNMYLLPTPWSKDLYRLDDTEINPRVTQEYKLNENYKKIVLCEIEDTTEYILLEIQGFPNYSGDSWFYITEKIGNKEHKIGFPSHFIKQKDLFFYNTDIPDYSRVLRAMKYTYPYINSQNTLLSQKEDRYIHNYFLDLQNAGIFTQFFKLYKLLIHIKVFSLDDFLYPFLKKKAHYYDDPNVVWLLLLVVLSYKNKEENYSKEDIRKCIRLNFNNLGITEYNWEEVVSFIQRFFYKNELIPKTGALYERRSSRNKNGERNSSHILTKIQDFTKAQNLRPLAKKEKYKKGPIEKKGAVQNAYTRLMANQMLFEHKTPIISFENTIENPFRADEFYDICKYTTRKPFEFWLERQMKLSKRKKKRYKEYLELVCNKNGNIVYSYKLLKGQYSFILR